MCFSVRTHFKQQDLESLKGPDIYYAKYFHGDTSVILSNRIFGNSHFVIVTHMNEYWPASLFSGICLRFRKTWRRMKIGVKIMQSEFGISVLRNGHESVSLSTLKW